MRFSKLFLSFFILFPLLNVGYASPVDENNYSLIFDGLDDMVQIPNDNAYDFVNEFTLGFYFKPSTNFDGGWLATKGLDGQDQNDRIWSFYAYNNRNDYYVEFVTSEGFHQFDVEANFSTDDWNTLIITYDGSNMSFYNNTTLLHSEPIQGTVVNSDYDLTIGVLPHDDISSYGAFFEGNIDHFHIWNKALDASDILNQNFNNLVSGEEGLVGFWNFNEGGGNVLTDLSGNINNGAVYGAEWSTDVPELIDPDPPHFENIYSISFDYMSGYAESNLSANEIIGGLESFTVEAWYKNFGVNSGSNEGYDDHAMIVSSYRRSGGGDPYGNFNLKINAGNGAGDDPLDVGKAYADYGAYSNGRVDNGLWNHIAASYELQGNGSWTVKLYVNGVLNDIAEGPLDEYYNHTSSQNSIRLNNHSPFAGDHMLECRYAGVKISSGIPYGTNDENSPFSPIFPLPNSENTIVNLDFSNPINGQLNDLSGNENHFFIYGGYSLELDAPIQSIIIEVPEDYSTIQQAIDASNDGDVIHVSEGVYFENINFNGKSVALIGENPTNTIIDGGIGNNLPAVTLHDYNYFSNTHITGFSIQNYGNDGISILNAGTPKVSNCILNGINGAPSGAIYVGGDGIGSSVIIERCLIFGNSAEGNQGGGIRVASNNGNSSVKLTYCTITQNYPDGLKVLGSATNVEINNSIIFNNSIENISNEGMIDISYSLVNNFVGEGVIDLDPLFVDPDNGDFTLQPSSPCIDSGDPDFPLDPDGSVSDMGAYSYQSTVDQYINHSLSFDGVDDYIEIPHNENQVGMSELSVMTWVRFDSYPDWSSGNGGYALLDKYQHQAANANLSYGLLTEYDYDALRFNLKLDNGVSINLRFEPFSSHLIVGQWHHVAGVFDGDKAHIYFDGQLMVSSESVSPGNINDTSYPLSIASGWGNIDYWDGSMSEISIWDQALSQAEVESYLTLSPTGLENGLVGYWNFNEGEGNVLTDLSSNGNNGSIYGAEWSTDHPGLIEDSEQPVISVTPESYDFGQVMYGEALETEFTIFNDGDIPLEYSTNIINLADENRGSNAILEFTIPTGFSPGTSSSDQYRHISTNRTVFIDQHQDIRSDISNSRSTTRDDHNILVYNNNFIDDIISEHPELTANYASYYNPDDLNDGLDVLFNIRGADLNPVETMEWIYNGGTWVGEWSSNTYPIQNWGIISGNVNGSGSGSQSVNFVDVSHWLGMNIDWQNLGVGQEPTDFMLGISINDPDADVIVTINHTSFGEVPLLVEKSYGNGRIILFNWDYNDSPNCCPDVAEMIRQVAYYASLNSFEMVPNSGTIEPGESQAVGVEIFTENYQSGDNQLSLLIESNDPENNLFYVPISFSIEPGILDYNPATVLLELYTGEEGEEEMVSISNSGGYPISWSAELQMDDNGLDLSVEEGGFSINPNSGTLLIGDNIGINLTYSTYNMVGGYNGNLLISTDLANYPEINIPVSITVLGIPQFNIWPEDQSLDFGEVFIGNEASHDFFLWNEGTGTLTIETIVEGEFYNMESSNLELAPGDSAAMTINYNPLNEGIHLGSLTLNTNDENFISYLIAFSGEGITPPVAVVSSDSNSFYIPQNDTIAKIFQLSNTGGSDLYWSIGSEGVRNIDGPVGSSETISEFRSRWANQMLFTPELTLEIQKEILTTINRKQTSKPFSKGSIPSFESGKYKKRNTDNLNHKSFRHVYSSKKVHSNPSLKNQFPTNTKLEVVSNLNSNRKILPPEAHRSRDGSLKITVLLDNAWQVWSTLDALSLYYSNYTIDEMYTDWDGEYLQEFLSSNGTDILMVPFGHNVQEYDLLGLGFGEAIQNFILTGGRLLFIGEQNWSSTGIFGTGWAESSYCCDSTLFKEGNSGSLWDESHPIMAGIDNSFEYNYIVTSYLEQNDPSNFNVESVMNLVSDTTNYAYSHAIFSKSVGEGHVVVLGFGFWNYTDDQARVLANSVQYLGGGTFVSFEPSFGILASGENLDIVASYESTGMIKGEYLAISSLLSNDIFNSNIEIIHNMRVVGTPSFTSSFESQDSNTFDFGEVMFDTSLYDFVEVMNYDSNAVSLSFALENQSNIFSIFEGNEMELLPFSSDTLVLLASGGLDEGGYNDMLFINTSHPELEESGVWLHAQIVPNINPIITNINDVSPDQGGWVTIEFTRSYFDGLFGNQRTELYTVELNDNGAWIASNSSVAYQSNRYITLVHTLQDSGIMGNGMTEFRIVAGMEEGTFFSQSAYGYSTDDIIPGVPINVSANQVGNYIVLNWDYAGEDYHHFSVYRHENADFEPHNDYHIGDVTHMSMVDSTAELFTTYYYILTATDFGGNSGDFSEAVEGFIHINFAPEIEPIEPQVMNEDQTYEIIVNASDQNLEDILYYTATSSSEDITIAIIMDTLTFTATENWHGMADITVSVTDNEFSDTTEFVLTVNSVNDAPEVFSLIGPATGSTVVITPNSISQGTVLYLGWSSSYDIDGDSISYGFEFYGGPFSPEITALIDTAVSDTIIQLPYDILAQELGLLGESVVSCDWTVFATDGIDTTTSNDIWSITIDASDVLSVNGELLPTEFALHQNYPNPFNPTTSLRYDLPKDSHVLITIYDIRGRKVKTLINEFQNAGYQITQWNATNEFGQPISAGMYIYAMQAGDFRTVKKMILLK